MKLLPESKKKLVSVNININININIKRVKNISTRNFSLWMQNCHRSKQFRIAWLCVCVWRGGRGTEQYGMMVNCAKQGFPFVEQTTEIVYNCPFLYAEGSESNLTIFSISFMILKQFSSWYSGVMTATFIGSPALLFITSADRFAILSL